MQIKDQIEKRDKILDDFEAEIGLPVNKPPGGPDEFERYLCMDATELGSLNHQSCAEIGYRIIQYSLYIQRCFNKEKSRLVTLRTNLDREIAESTQQYSGSWEMKRQQAINNNDYATTAQEVISNIEQRMVRLEFVASGLKNLAEQIKNIQFVKMREARDVG